MTSTTFSARKKLKVGSTPMVNTLKYVTLLTTAKPFDDVRVRQAIAWAIPYDKVLESSVYGRAAPMYGGPADAPVGTGWPQPFPYSYDPEKARALLAQPD